MQAAGSLNEMGEGKSAESHQYINTESKHVKYMRNSRMEFNICIYNKDDLKSDKNVVLCF